MMTEAEQRQAIVDEAMTWLRTPYHHYGKIKGVGTDCSQMPLLVYSSCGLFEVFDSGDYPSDWHLHRAEERYLRVVRELAKREITEAEVKKGDFVVFKIGRCFAHGAIVVDYPQVIHAAIRIGVIMDRADQGDMAGRDRLFFTFWGDA